MKARNDRRPGTTEKNGQSLSADDAVTTLAGRGPLRVARQFRPARLDDCFFLELRLGMQVISPRGAAREVSGRWPRGSAWNGFSKPIKSELAAGRARRNVTAVQKWPLTG